MLEQIDKILKSNWSSSWFQKTSSSSSSSSSSQIGPKFKNEQPTNNLNTMSDQVLKILLNNSNYPGYDDIGNSRSSSNNDEQSTTTTTTLNIKDLTAFGKDAKTSRRIKVASLNRHGQ